MVKEMFSSYLYNGEAGDEHELCVVMHDGSGIKESELFNRTLPFYNWRLKRLKNKLTSRLRRRILKGLKIERLTSTKATYFRPHPILELAAKKGAEQE